MLLETILCEFAQTCTTENAPIKLETVLCKFGCMIQGTFAFITNLFKPAFYFFQSQLENFCCQSELHLTFCHCVLVQLTSFIHYSKLKVSLPCSQSLQYDTQLHYYHSFEQQTDVLVMSLEDRYFLFNLPQISYFCGALIQYTTLGIFLRIIFIRIKAQIPKKLV